MKSVAFILWFLSVWPVLAYLLDGSGRITRKLQRECVTSAFANDYHGMKVRELALAASRQSVFPQPPSETWLLIRNLGMSAVLIALGLLAWAR